MKYRYSVDSQCVGKSTNLLTGEVWLNKNIHPARDVSCNTSASWIWWTQLVGGFNPSEKYESVGIIPNIWEKKNVPNHQPDNLIATFTSGCLTNKSSQIMVHNNISMKPVKLPFTKLLQRFEISMMTFQFRYILGWYSNFGIFWDDIPVLVYIFGYILVYSNDYLTMIFMMKSQFKHGPWSMVKPLRPGFSQPFAWSSPSWKARLTAASNVFRGNKRGEFYQGFPTPNWELHGNPIGIYPLVNVYITMENHHF